MFEKLAWWLIIIGALNWLLVGLFQLDVVAAVFGGSEVMWSRVVYVLIGLAGIYLLPQAFGVKMVHKRGE